MKIGNSEEDCLYYCLGRIIKKLAESDGDHKEALGDN